MIGADGVFHIAGWYKTGARDKSPGMAVNVHGTRNTLEMMRELGIPKGVYTSTLAINSDTHGKIVDETYRFAGRFLGVRRTKWLAHVEVAEPKIAEGLPLVIVMPGPIYGPGDTSGFRQMWRDYLRGKLPILPGGYAASWGHVEDVAQAHLLAMANGTVGHSLYCCRTDPFARRGHDAGAKDHRGAGAAPDFAGCCACARVDRRLIERAVPVPPNYSAETLRALAGTTYSGSSAKAQR